jgi:hypothetical protein
MRLGDFANSDAAAGLLLDNSAASRKPLRIRL